MEPKTGRGRREAHNAPLRASNADARTRDTPTSDTRPLTPRASLDAGHAQTGAQCSNASAHGEPTVSRLAQGPTGSSPVVALAPGAGAALPRAVPGAADTAAGASLGAVHTATLALLGIGAALRVWAYAVRGPLWTDEAGLALNVVGRDLHQVARPFVFNQYAPYLYMLESKLANAVLGSSELALRFLSVAAALLLLPAMFALTRRVGGQLAALFAVACLAVGHTWIYFATEFKPYEQDALIATALCFLSLRALEAQAPQRSRQLAMLGACGVIAPWLSLPSIFVLAAAGAALLYDVWQRKLGLPAALRLAGIGAAWLASFAVHYFTFLHVEAAAASDGLQSYWSAMDAFGPFPPRSLHDLRWYAAKFFYVFHVFVTPVGFGLRYLAGAMWLAGMYLVWRKSRPQFVLWLAPLLLVFAASAAHAYIIADRMLLFMTPAIIVPFALACAALATARAPQPRPGTAALAVVLAVGLWLPPSVHLFDKLSHPQRGPDVRTLVAYLAQHFRSGDRLFVETQVEWIYRLYARRAGFDVPFAMADGRLYRPEQTYRVLDALAGAPRLWALVPTPGPRGPRTKSAASWVAKAERVVTERLDRFGRLVKRVDGGNTRLYLYNLASAEASPPR